MDITNCVVCSSTEVTKEPFFYCWNKKYYWILRCTECTHQFVFPFLTEQDQKKIYDDRYFSKEGDWVCGLFDEDYVSSEANLRREAQEILSMLPVHSGKLLEIGCAGGYFLDETRRHGFDAIGIELNESMVHHARNVLGLDVLCQRIEDIPLDHFKASLNVVVMLDVLEHIPSPRTVLDKISHWTRTDSLLLVRGPLNNNLIAKCKEAIRRVVGIKKQLPGYPLDVNTFSKKSLTLLLTLNRFKICSYINETWGFANILARRQ